MPTLPIRKKLCLTLTRNRADVAGDMTIVKEPAKDANMPLESAHLNKLGELVNANQEAVGFSTGGDSTGK
jgi:hypothetical protein